MPEPLDSNSRLSRLEETGIMDSPTSEGFDRLTRIAALAVGVPVALVSFVDDRRQFFKSSFGLPEPWKSARGTDLKHSFCQFVAGSGEPLIVTNAVEHPLLKDSEAIDDLEAIAYLGFPICYADEVMGSFCVIDHVVREWEPEEIALVEELSQLATELVYRHSEMAAAEEEVDELTESQRRIEQILDSTGEGIFGIDHNGLFTFVNKKAVELLGYPNQVVLLGKEMHELIRHSAQDGKPCKVSESRILKALRKSESIHTDEEVFWKADGTPLPVEYRSHPCSLVGATAAVVTFVDITDRIEREEKLKEALMATERANRQKSRFLANVSHEIRTPMNAILGFGEILEGHVDNPKAKQYVAAIRSSGESLLRLINDILDLSKIESGKLELRCEPTAIRGIVDSIRILFVQQAMEKNLEFNVDIDDDCPEYLVLDDLRLRQILHNLVSNSLKFTREGFVKARISVVKDPLDDEKISLVIKVTDSGSGIPEDQQKLVFRPFQQADHSGPAKGTGLGLSICRELARLMGGKINLESTVDKGSTFTVTIPDVEVAAASEVDSEEFSTDANFNMLKPSRILVVDDNPFNIDLVLGYLDGSHHRTNSAANGREAVEKVRDWMPDVVLMDIRMPVMDGKEARKRIKEDPDLQNIPVVAVTASSLLHHTRELRRDFDGYMRKPFSGRQLFRALARILPAVDEAVVESAIADSKEDIEMAEVDASLWGPLLDQLESWRRKRIPELAEAMVIGEIADFAQEMIASGEKASCAAVVSYGNSLAEQAGNFELSKIEVTLGSFKDLVSEIELLWRDSGPRVSG